MPSDQVGPLGSGWRPIDAYERTLERNQAADRRIDSRRLAFEVCVRCTDNNPSVLKTTLMQGNEMPPIERQDGALAGSRDRQYIAIGRGHIGRASRVDRFDIVSKNSQGLDNG